MTWWRHCTTLQKKDITHYTDSGYYMYMAMISTLVPRLNCKENLHGNNATYEHIITDFSLTEHV